MTDKILTDQMYKALIALAKRKHKTTNVWCLLSQDNIVSYECLICGSSFYGTSFNAIDNHGFFHLKEKGLLVFS